LHPAKERGEIKKRGFAPLDISWISTVLTKLLSTPPLLYIREEGRGERDNIYISLH